MMTFSEFGRRVVPNASGGTDHGTAAPMFMIGKGVQEGVVGNHPSLTNLDQGDLRYLIDLQKRLCDDLAELAGDAEQADIGGAILRRCRC